jgi:hypothetical protein
MPLVRDGQGLWSAEDCVEELDRRLSEWRTDFTAQNDRVVDEIRAGSEALAGTVASLRNRVKESNAAAENEIRNLDELKVTSAWIFQHSFFVLNPVFWLSRLIIQIGVIQLSLLWISSCSFSLKVGSLVTEINIMITI